MSVGNSSLDLPIRDLFTRVIPGFVLLFPGLAVFTYAFDEVVNYPSLFLVALLVLSLFTGEMIDQFRNGVYRVPPSFREFLYDVTGDPVYLPFRKRAAIKIREVNRINGIVTALGKNPQVRFFKSHIYYRIIGVLRIDRTRIWNRLSMEFDEQFEEEFGVDFQDDSMYDFFDLFMIELEESLGRRALRAQMNFNLAANIRIGMYISFFLYGIIFASSVVTGDFIGSSFVAFVLSMIVFCSLTGILVLFSRAEANYAELLFKESLIPIHRNRAVFRTNHPVS